MLITTLIVSFLVCCRLEVMCGQAGVVSGLQAKAQLCFSLQPGHHSSLIAPNLHPIANQERNDQCGYQHHSRDLLMMGIVMPETCSAYKKYNKIVSGIQLVSILQQSQTMFVHSACNKLNVMLTNITYFDRNHLQNVCVCVCVFLSGAHVVTIVKFLHLHT